MGLYKADFMSGDGGTAVACPLGKLVADGGVSESILPYNLGRNGVVVYNNEIHILGTGNTTSHYKFNGTSWTSVSTLPYEFYDGGLVVYNNEIHLLGGNGNNRAHYKWDGSTWTSVSTLPYNFYGGSAVVYNNEIHILGSSDTGSDRINCTKHYSIAQPPSIQGYLKQGTKIYYPQTSSPITTNLQSTTDGYLVTSDGEVKISVNKEDLEV